MPRRGVGCLTPGCTEDPDDGEGFDGYCGNCADAQEEKMGYTHYWTQTRDFNEQEMGDIAASVRKIITTATDGREFPNNYTGEGSFPLVICGFDGTGEPILSKEKISFNGQGPDLDHETFYFDAKRELPYENARPDQLGWRFCKTAHKPYDAVVTACLTFLQADYGFEVSSDGDIDDWDAGVKLAEEALGRQFANPLIVEQLVA
jgi:hypothetical protein